MPKKKFRIVVKGVVQGVGFRPFIYQLANTHNLKGWVLNSSRGVIIEVEGEESELDVFVKNIEAKAPPLAKVESVDTEELPLEGFDSFSIKHSLEEKEQFLLISPDISICDDCLKELFDPDDRRYRYPFINCTNCGPRFTIIHDIPYDRPKTTMKHFTMCPACQAEYDNPSDRRFHAQPNACPVCGPELELAINWGVGHGSWETEDQSASASSQPLTTCVECDDPMAETISALKNGKIVAVKGLGGFHLACDAENEQAVKLLRERKRRYGKPLAVMMSDIDQIKEHCEVTKDEKKFLMSPQRPIILLERKSQSTIAYSVAPDNKYLGVMLPYTPLHYVILRESKMVLVMTSGNLSEEPIAMENDEAIRRLGHIADYFLLHNRDIYSRYDDSVARVFRGELVMLRRARSFAPFPIHLPFESRPVLATGPELKNTFCLTKDKYAFVSQHIGDMENLETEEHFKATLELYQRLFRIKPEIVAYDLHPEYLSTKFAKSLEGAKLIGVQHHFAHIVSCMAENNVQDKVIGISFDGLGYGTDGKIWGGEILIADWKDFKRAAHLRYVPMPGGAAAIKKPYRMAFGYLYSFFGEDYNNFDLEYLKDLDETEQNIMKKQIDRELNAPLTSSCGRLFDAVSSLCRIRDEVFYEGEAAIDLEMLADVNVKESYAFAFRPRSEVRGLRSEKRGPADRAQATTKNEPSFDVRRSTFDEPLIIDTKPIIEGVIRDLEENIPVSTIAAKFHNTVVEIICGICERLRESENINQVALSGGVFQNFFLLTRALDRLQDSGFEVFYHKKVPTNDGGVSLGEAVVANALTEEELSED